MEADVVLANATRTGVSADERSYAAYLTALSWGKLIVEAQPLESGNWPGRAEELKVAARAGRPVRVGVLVHSLLGAGLRRVSCGDHEACGEACRKPGGCAYHALMGAGGVPGGGMLAGVARVPSPCIVQADWDPVWRPGDPLRFALCLLGRAEDHARDVARALEVSFGAGVGSARVPMAMVRCLNSRGRLEGPEVTGSGGSDVARGIVRVELRTPLRLVRKKQPVRRFSLEDLVRDLNFRLAVWGSFHQGLPWAPRWALLAEDARAARVLADDTRWVSFVRYSGSQRRAIRLGGLLGSVTLAGVTPRLLALLRAAEVMGAGKGSTIGLGRVRVEVEED